MINFRHKFKKMITHPFGIAVLIIFGVAFLALITAAQYSTNLAVLAKVVGVFALLGAFLGTIYATDPCSNTEFKVKNRPVIRTLISFCIGGLLAYVFHLKIQNAIIFAFLFGIIGWLGMRWAKYVDF